MIRSIAILFCGVACAGWIASVWTHIVAFQGIDPQSRFEQLWIVELILFLLLLPLTVYLLRHRFRPPVLGISPRHWRVLSVFLIYYAVHFYVFIGLAAEHLRPDYTWRMFSAGWILLFALCVTFYGAGGRRGSDRESGGQNRP